MPLFSVLSLNLRFGLADDGPNGWPYRRQSVLRLFREICPDFIAVQEANGFQTEYLMENLPEYAAIGRRVPAPPFWQDNILFFRRPIACRSSRHFFLSETPRYPSRSFGSQFPRQATMGLFEWSGHQLVCINTHLDFETPAQLGGVRVIQKERNRLPENVPTVLMGDFNATPDSACYRWLTGHTREKDGEKGFKETFIKPYPGTFHGFTGKPVTGYIDWVLYHGQLVLQSCRVLDDTSTGPNVSDHFPVMAAFAFVDAPG